MSKVLQRTLEAKLAALKGPEWDSSSDEEAETLKERNIGRIANKKRKPSSAIDSDGDNDDINVEPSATKSKAKTKSSNSASDSNRSGVIYLGHLPVNFEEKEISAFLSQFGDVLKVRLSREKKSGRSRGYGFVQFVDPDVAKIVADTMSGYFLMDKRLVCHIIPSDKVHPQLFVGAGKKFKIVNGSQLFANELDQKLSTLNGIKQISKNLIKRDKAKRAKLTALGIDYDYPPIEKKAKLESDTKSNSSTTNKKQNIKINNADKATGEESNNKASKKTKIAINEEKELKTSSIKNKNKEKKQTLIEKPVDNTSKSLKNEIEEQNILHDTKQKSTKPNDDEPDKSQITTPEPKSKSTDKSPLSKKEKKTQKEKKSPNPEILKNHKKLSADHKINESKNIEMDSTPLKDGTKKIKKAKTAVKKSKKDKKRRKSV